MALVRKRFRSVLEVLEKPKRQRVGVCWEAEKLSEVSSNRSFTISEQTLLNEIAGSLAKSWGYRAGENGNHVRMELHLHEKAELYHVTNLTDGIFRNLQQYADQGLKLPRKCDLEDKFRAALQTPFELPPESYNSGLLPFFKNEKNTDDLVRLASQPLEGGNRSRSFVMIILLCRAFLCLFSGNILTTREHLQSFQKFL